MNRSRKCAAVVLDNRAGNLINERGNRRYIMRGCLKSFKKALSHMILATTHHLGDRTHKAEFQGCQRAEPYLRLLTMVNEVASVTLHRERDP